MAWLTVFQPGARAEEFRIGVAKTDITPSEPIRMTGYAVRKSPSTGVTQQLWAKALAIQALDEKPAVLITLDLCGISEQAYQETVTRLGRSAGLSRDRIAIGCSHTHSGPCTTGWAPNIFAQDIPADQQQVIDRYTRELLGRIEKTALNAIKDCRAGKLAVGQGTVGFARNRRARQGTSIQLGDNPSGPADHALPLLVASDEQGKPRAIVANYACHCTTLGGEFNQICGDWAGYAQETLERELPGTMALITIGCGADANPHPRGGADAGLALAKEHGTSLAREVQRLLGSTLKPVGGNLTTRAREIQLPFGSHFTRAEWETRAQKPSIVGYHARKNLQRLDLGETLPNQLYYPVVTWTFGDDLTCIFLPGEVVVDYALRLKKELANDTLWITGYAQYVPCYIPSRRILAEGGYEAEDSLWYYDRPARLSTAAEDLIIVTVRELLK